ncbi:hypothetical protein SERLADRAFT_418566 [Serpula lacrymans var. lacrymans S7.9]|uniref:Major facilitator superfamily (MFS) profile domain-containing protein n=1 Tax=Serpula lacrymans var. lacrymans (strain S7.9) TaxID=578457 RepID=F8PCE2_SERL9|nr:uncharacterized protein SERLADRAFT_418566 [Serpula lacrymans var. lacrymans S7.9]EGO19340.1 hypothetical protein SERLADRAFT_418566 [Serpula lacrymans var. lacrymans S7.9]
MASVTPRASGFWADSTRMSYFNSETDLDSADIEGTAACEGDEYDDGRTPLDRTIDRIGMGWLADNMWIQAVAIILPRVQQHYSISDNYIGLLSSSMFAGMMFGAVGWGTCSDLMGRSTAFNATLFFTSLFGILSSFARSYWLLCVLLFFLGSAVGGSMPTDGTLLLEHMPKGKQYLVTALSVFFSFGSVLAAVVGLLVVPQNSCKPGVPCDVEVDNRGWQYMLVSLGIITLSMFLARMVFFRLHESPRYLVHAGRHQEALESLQMISRFNGSEIPLDLDDVNDHHPTSAIPKTGTGENEPFLSQQVNSDYAPRNSHNAPPATDGTVLFDAQGELPTQGSSDFLRNEEGGMTDYRATGESPTSLDAHLFKTPIEEVPSSSLARGDGQASRPALAVHVQTDRNGDSTPSDKDSDSGRSPRSHARPLRRHSRQRSSSVAMSRASSMYEVKRCVGGVLPRWIRRPLLAWLDRLAMVLSPEWLRTTVLVWAVWCFMSLAYTMFNVYFPKLLETASSISDADASPKTLEENLWDVVIFTIGGCPGAILGAYLVETPFGRRGSLALTTFITALFCMAFVLSRGPFAVRVSSVGISLSSTTMYAVLYGWTPEIFGTKVRGTACGIASALSRIGGMIAPMLGGSLLVINRAFPVYTSVVVYLVAVVCILLLKENEGASGVRTFVH